MHDANSYVKLIYLINLLENTMNYSTRSLRALVELAQTKKFTMAAERCHMTQSALSQVIAKLESDLGLPLFIRHTRSVELTAEGERLLRSAKSVLSELHIVTEELQAVRSLSKGSFSMAIVPSLASYWLPPLLQSFRAVHPDIRIRVVDGSSSRCHELVQQGLVDFSLNSQPGTSSEFAAQRLFEEALYVALSPSHPLCAQTTSLRASDLRGVAFIQQHGLETMLLRRGSKQITARDWLRQVGAVEADVEVANLGTLAGLVEADFGACIMPACSLPLLHNRAVKAIKIAPSAVVRIIYSSHRRDHQLPPAAAAFLDLAIAQTPQSSD